MKSGLDAMPLFLLDDLLMRKLYEIFNVLKIQKRIVSTVTICGNRVYAEASIWIGLQLLSLERHSLTSFPFNVTTANIDAVTFSRNRKTLSPKDPLHPI